MNQSADTRPFWGPILMVVAGVFMVTMMLVTQVRQRLMIEQDGALQVARYLVQSAIAARPANDAHQVLALRQQMQDMPPLHHVRLFFLPIDAAELQAFRDQLALMQSDAIWQLLHSDVADATVSLADQERVLIVADPSELLAQSAAEFKIIFLLVLGLLGWGITRVIMPLRLLRFALSRMQQENNQVVARLIALQEGERRDLARELHDDFGPALFGIKSEAMGIGRVAEAITADEIKARTAIVVKLVDDLQKTTKRLLSRLRPIAVAEIGLRAALGRLVEECQGRYMDIRWTFDSPPLPYDLPPDHAVALYRAAQDCLINAANNSGAKSVLIELTGGPPTRLVVVDDGRGVAQDILYGNSMIALRDRIQMIGGRLTVTDLSQGGTRIEVEV